MDDLEKRKIYNLIQLALQAFQSNKYQINSYTPYYGENGTSGIKFSVKVNETELAFFAGFSTDKKYENQLLFGVLKSDCNEKVSKLKHLDDDENGNKIQEKIKIDTRFTSLEENSQKEKISKWLNEQIRTFLSMYSLFNGSLKKSSNKEQNPIKRKLILSFTCLLFGCLGVHRFLLRQWGSGFLQLFTMGGFYIWWIIDTIRLFTGNYPDSDGILLKDKIREYKDANKVEYEKEIESYENIDTKTWFKIVELPWLITVLGIVPSCFCPIFAETNEIVFIALAAVSSIIFLIGLISIFATIGKKRKIRIVNDIPITKNPYTWFLSKIGKAVCGTTILVLGIGIFVLIAIFTTSVSKSLSSGSTSSKRATSGSSGSTRGSNSASTEKSNKTSIKYYYCEYCGHKEINLKLLLSGHCNRHPTAPYSVHHKLYEGTIKSDYYCKYCGHKERTIDHLTSGYCQKHPNGSGKGHHLPAL
ncbi:TM2 domain-containing protein [Treponema succinifaciens]|nr:TM2 domain-containing protein [Treponema succinifaciens]